MDIDDDAVLRGVDAKTYLSLNGPRTTNMISRLIPSSAQVIVGIACLCLCYYVTAHPPTRRPTTNQTN